jgi:hypothetical protein
LQIKISVGAGPLCLPSANQDNHGESPLQLLVIFRGNHLSPDKFSDILDVRHEDIKLDNLVDKMWNLLYAVSALILIQNGIKSPKMSLLLQFAPHGIVIFLL